MSTDVDLKFKKCVLRYAKVNETQDVQPDLHDLRRYWRNQTNTSSLIKDLMGLCLSLLDSKH